MNSCVRRVAFCGRHQRAIRPPQMGPSRAGRRNGVSGNINRHTSNLSLVPLVLVQAAARACCTGGRGRVTSAPCSSTQARHGTLHGGAPSLGRGGPATSNQRVLAPPVGKSEQYNI
ncbi:hypothetical protein SFRURICE_001564 [Spodoptera frugiperda]|nr:hypothetical protein SFRURICE_001564 [Spodoptera frugiperda]